MWRNCWNVLRKRIAQNKSLQLKKLIIFILKCDKLYVKWKDYNNSVFREMWKLNLIFLIKWFNYLSNFLLKRLILASLKWEMDKLHFGKLETTLVGLCVLITSLELLNVNIKKDVMLTNPCFFVFGDAFRVLHFYCTHFQAIFSLTKFFINKLLIQF